MNQAHTVLSNIGNATLYLPGNTKNIANSYTESELIIGLSKKDPAAFSYLYDRYASVINGIIYRRVQNNELGEDILQDVFIKIWKNFDKYNKSKGRLFTWMIVLTKNIITDFLRSNQNLAKSKTFTDNFTAAEKPHSCVFEKLDALPIDQHAAKIPDTSHLRLIELAYFHGMTQAEIAAFTGIPLDSIRTKMRFAISKLRKKLT